MEESLAIGPDIEVKVISISRSRVMLAVTAPREVSIRRVNGKSDYKRDPQPPSEHSVQEMAEPDAKAEKVDKNAGE